MKEKAYLIGLSLVILIFTAIFIIVVIPPAIEIGNIFDAFGAGFVTPIAAGYSSDVICCYAILLLWVIWESNKIRYGWVCVVLGLVPGVAVGLGLYLILRHWQLKKA